MLRTRWRAELTLCILLVASAYTPVARSGPLLEWTSCERAFIETWEPQACFGLCHLEVKAFLDGLKRLESSVLDSRYLHVQLVLGPKLDRSTRSWLIARRTRWGRTAFYRFHVLLTYRGRVVDPTADASVSGLPLNDYLNQVFVRDLHVTRESIAATLGYSLEYHRTLIDQIERAAEAQRAEGVEALRVHTLSVNHFLRLLRNKRQGLRTFLLQNEIEG